MDGLERRIFKEAHAIADKLVHLDPSCLREIVDRLARYETKVAGCYICPLCWMELEVHRPIRPVERDNEDVQFCSGCRTEFSDE